MHILFLADASSVHSYRWIKYFSERGGGKWDLVFFCAKYAARAKECRV